MFVSEDFLLKTRIYRTLLHMEYRSILPVHCGQRVDGTMHSLYLLRAEEYICVATLHST